MLPLHHFLKTKERLLIFSFFSSREFFRLIIIQKAPLIDKIINGNLDLKKY